MIRVLLVGDAPGFENVVDDIFSSHPQMGKVGPPSSGEEALYRIKKLSPELVLIRVPLRSANSLELTRRIKTIPSAPKIILLTSLASPEYQKAASAMGADDVLALSEAHAKLMPVIGRLFSTAANLLHRPEHKGPPLIFIVDDERELAEVASFYLTRAGYEVWVFHDSLAALQAVTSVERKPDLMVTDFSMPGMNGLELIQSCKALLPSLKTISASGRLQKEDLEVYPIKPDRILTKPFYPEDLVAAVQAVLAG